VSRQMRFDGMDFAADLAESIRVIRENQPKDAPYYGLFSGGKDSVALKEVARLAGADVEWHYNVTTIDPPELVRFIREYHPDVTWHRPKHGNFFRRAAEVKGFPTRRTRWCCDEYKESCNPPGRALLMGIRAEESGARAARWGFVTEHSRTKSPVVNPLIKWSSDDLWDFIRTQGVKYCSLYNEGFHRLGCIGCPMSRASGRRQQFDRWPKYEQKWRTVFRKVWERRTGTTQRDGQVWFGNRYFDDWEEMWGWWLSNRSLPEKKQEAE